MREVFTQQTLIEKTGGRHENRASEAVSQTELGGWCQRGTNDIRCLVFFNNKPTHTILRYERAQRIIACLMGFSVLLV